MPVEGLGRVALEDDLHVDEVDDDVSGDFTEVCRERENRIVRHGAKERAYTFQKSSARRDQRLGP